MAGLKAWLFLTILCISRMQIYHRVKMLNSFCVWFCWFKPHQNNAAYILHVLYLYTFCICKMCFLVQRRGGNGCTGLKKIQTWDCGSSVRSDRKLCHYWFVQELEACVRRKSVKTTVGGGHLLFVLPANGCSSSVNDNRSSGRYLFPALCSCGLDGLDSALWRLACGSVSANQSILSPWPWQRIQS